MSLATQKIPKQLIYEMVNGTPIYYKGYKDYMLGIKQLAEVMGSSKFQSFLASELIFLIKSLLGKRFLIFSNEIGLQFSKQSWRAADIALVKRGSIKKLDNKYLSTPPDYVIEIDTKADLSEITNPLGYYQEKTDELLRFGVKKVVWIFTDTQKIMLAESGSSKWEILDWNQEVDFFEGVQVNIQQILEENDLV